MDILESTPFLKKCKDIYELSRKETSISKILFLEPQHLKNIKKSEQIYNYYYFQVNGIDAKLRDIIGECFKKIKSSSSEIEHKNNLKYLFEKIAIILVELCAEDDIPDCFQNYFRFEIKKCIINLNYKWFNMAHSIIEKSNFSFNGIDKDDIPGIQKWIFRIMNPVRNSKKNINPVKFDSTVKVFSYVRSYYDRPSIPYFNDYIPIYSKPEFYEIRKIRERERTFCRRRSIPDFKKVNSMISYIENSKKYNTCSNRNIQRLLISHHFYFYNNITLI